MPIWRCQNEACSTDPAGRLIFDFSDDLPICPTCGTDGRKRPDIVIRLKLMHYDPPHPKLTRRGKGHAACDPNKKVHGTELVGFTGDPGTVNCQACIESAEWQAAAKEREMVPGLDFTVAVQNGVVTRG